ncbi:Exportin-6 [Actinomortierella wolfii]|nr:Exportin-6 [Actinomortierella wolfii]
MDDIERLLAEFYGTAASNEQKRAIEAQLERFKPSLQECQHMIVAAKSDYLAFYGFSKLQHVIVADWMGMDSQQQAAIRAFLLQYLQEHYDADPGEAAKAGKRTRPMFVSNKAIQTLSDIAQLDGPERFPELFPEIYRLIQCKEKQGIVLGWALLDAVLQDYMAMCPNAGTQSTSGSRRLGLSQQRRQIWATIKPLVPGILSIILQHLDSCYDKILITPLATNAPAPSPVDRATWGQQASGTGRSFSNASAMNMTSPGSFSGSRAVPGSLSSSFASQHPSDSIFSQLSERRGTITSINSEQDDVGSFSKSPTAALRKSLTNFLAPGNQPSDLSSMLGTSPSNTHGLMGPPRQRTASITELGRMAMRRGSATLGLPVPLESRRQSIESFFVNGNKMDSHTRTTCQFALQSLATILSCPVLDAQQIGASGAINTILKYATMHQSKTVDLAVLALRCLNDLVARPGFLATNQEAMMGAVKLMVELVRYFNGAKDGDGIDDVDENYLQMFMHFVSLFCVLDHLERAERFMGVPLPDFLYSFAKLTLEKVSVDNMKLCMQVWKSLLDSIIESLSETPRPLPANHSLRRLQEPLMYFMKTLVDRFYQMEGAIQTEEIFLSYEIEEEDLDDMSKLMETFVGQMGELFLQEVIECLHPLLVQQLGQLSHQNFDECKTLPVTLGILAKVAFNFMQHFEQTKDFTFQLLVELIKKTRLAFDAKQAILSGGASRPGKDGAKLANNVTLAFIDTLPAFFPWLHELWKSEAAKNEGAGCRMAQDVYFELLRLLTHLFHSLIPPTLLGVGSSSAGSGSDAGQGRGNASILGPMSATLSAGDSKLLKAVGGCLYALMLHVKMPAQGLLPLTPDPSLNDIAHTFTGHFWDIPSVRELTSYLSRILMNPNTQTTMHFFVPEEDSTVSSESQGKPRKNPESDENELLSIIFRSLSNGIVLSPLSRQDQKLAASQAFGTLIAPVIYPFQNALQEARATAQSGYLANTEVKERIRRSLYILESLVSSVEDASSTARAIIAEGLKTGLPYIQELFDAYQDDHVMTLSMLAFFKVLVTSLARQVGSSYCIGVGSILIDRITAPLFLNQIFGHIQPPPGTPPSSIRVQQEKGMEQIHETLLVLQSLLQRPGREYEALLPNAVQFLLIGVGPILLTVPKALQAWTNSSNGSISNDTNNGRYNGVNVHEVLLRYYSTLQNLLDHHWQSFFSRSGNSLLDSILEQQRQQRHGSLAAKQDGAAPFSHDDSALKEQSLMALDLCMNFFVQGLQRPEPDLVRQVIEILTYLNDSSPLRLFGRLEFQERYRPTFLQVLLSLVTLRPEQGTATSAHGPSVGDNQGTNTAGSQDLLRDEIAMLMHKIVAAKSDFDNVASGGVLLQQLISQVCASLPPSCQLVASPLSVQETLWRSLTMLCDSAQCAQGLEDFSHDLRLFIQQSA